MNFTILFCTFLILFELILLIKFSYKKHKYIASPGVLSGMIWICFNIPYLILLTFDQSIFNQTVLYVINGDIDSAVINYTLVQCLFFIFLYSGINSKKSNSPFLGAKDIFYNSKTTVIKLTFTVSLFIFIVGIIEYITTNGGISNIILNLAYRSEMLTGNLIVQLGVQASSITVLTGYLIYISRKQNLARKVIFICFVLAIMACTSLQGSRRSMFSVLIYIFIIGHYGITKTNLKKYLKYIILIPFIIPIFVGMNLIRTNDFSTNNIQYVKKEINSNYSIFVKDLTYIPIYIGITNYYNSDNFYYGKTFNDLFFSLIPKRYYPDKPPIDEGYYCSSIFVTGRYITPPSNRETLEKYSWPPETLGNAYWNFGIIGIIVFAYLLGRIYNYLYISLINKKNNFFLLIVYPYILLNFQLSNLRITSTMIYCISFLVIILFSKAILKIFGSKTYYNLKNK